MKAVWILMGKELRDGLRNRWIISSVLLLGSLAILLSLLGSTPTGTVTANMLDINVVSLTSLSVYLIPLIAFMLSFDALAGESESGTLLLLLTYPISRAQIIFGKFCAHLCILMLAIVVGYGGSACINILLADGSSSGGLNYLWMMVSSWMLGAIFLVIGYLISAAVKQRSTAISIAIGIWLVMVVLFDLALLGILVADQEQSISQNFFSKLMLLNPTDMYRIFNLTNISSSIETYSLAGSADVKLFTLFDLCLAFILWLALPLTASIAIFKRREL
ncbi:MAG: ABC transporter permease subunit [Pseudomonadales bacterium]|nr:ABC transporter permease subunit [Pseudomonadales bacterium]